MMCAEQDQGLFITLFFLILILFLFLLILVIFIIDGIFNLVAQPFLYGVIFIFVPILERSIFISMLVCVFVGFSIYS